jgi:hypothetical protein
MNGYKVLLNSYELLVLPTMSSHLTVFRRPCASAVLCEDKKFIRTGWLKSLFDRQKGLDKAVKENYIRDVL